MKSAVIVTNIPTPYRIPLFNEVHSQLLARNIAFKVVFAALTYPRRKWKIDMAECTFPWKVLDSAKLPLRNPEKAVFTYRGIGRELPHQQPSISIVSGFSLATVRLWLRAKLLRQPYLIWSGAIAIPGREQSALRRVHRRLLVTGASGGIVYGSRARDYLASLGMPPDSIQVAINTVDTGFYAEETKRLRSLSPAAPPTTKTLLCLGHLTHGKRIDLVLHALARISRQRRDFELLLVGSGPAEPTLRQTAADLGLLDAVRFEGFVQREQIPSYLAKTSCLLFPSEYDIWGLVLNEAMAAGVLCLASNKAGATADLVMDGKTGFALDFEDTSAVAERLAWVLDQPQAAATIAAQAQHFIREQASIPASAKGFVQAIERALAPVKPQ